MTWNSIRNFGKIKYFNLSYVILIGVPILAEIYQVIHNAAFGHFITFVFPCPFKLLYASSLSYALGILVYQLNCPEIIKRFSSEDEYVNESLGLYERLQPDKKYEIILANLVETQEDIKKELIELHAYIESNKQENNKEKISRYNEIIELVYKSCIQRYLIKQYNLLNITRPFAIYTSGIFYVIGTLLLFYLLILKSIKVFTI